LGPPTPTPTAQTVKEYPETPELRRRAARADDLGWLAAPTASHPWLADQSRSSLVQQKHARLAAGDALGVARASAVLAAEAQLRAWRVLERWSRRIDPETGLLPKGITSEGNVWEYADTGSDLYPHLVIAASLLQPALLPTLSDVIGAERRLARQQTLPDDVDLATNQAEQDDLEDRIYGSVEYAKDALLPLSERLGAGPWRDRMAELMDLLETDAPVTTRFGRIPSYESEVNGQTLQVLSRLAWATGDDRYRLAAERIARAYLELALPATEWVPARTWNFARERSNTDQAQLRDHGNEVVAGLVEYHLLETMRGDPRVAEHRVQIRSMLDRLLAIGLTKDGHWKSSIDLDTGASLKDTYSDNWGYLYAAYLTQAAIEERFPNGDLSAAQRYRAAVDAGLAAVARLELYPWQGIEQDGYADTIESALYLLNRVDAPATAAWVDRQAGTLFGAQDDAGMVEDSYLDGNFVRTSLLYSAWQTRGVRLDPWLPSVMLGAAPDGDCLLVVAEAAQAWEGRLRFDVPRHRLHLRLPFNYPRLNEWPEWFTVEADQRYRIEGLAESLPAQHDGAALSAGLLLRLEPGAESRLRVCASEAP
jgi:hypothetical protein